MQISASNHLVSLFVLAVYVICCDGERSDHSMTYNALYQEGRQAYTKERWFEAIDFLEKAIEDWHWYRDELAQCRIKCKKVSGLSGEGGGQV